MAGYFRARGARGGMIASLRPGVVLIRPPSQMGELARIVSAQHPINLLYLCAYLREHGFEPHLIDYEIDAYSDEDVCRRIEELAPLCVGVSCFTPQIIAGHRIAQALRGAFPALPLLIGGPHATALPRATLEEFPAFDAAVAGEGEETLVEVCSRLRDGRDLCGVAGTAHRAGGGVVQEAERPRIAAYGDLPMPARDLLDMAKYPGAAKSGAAAGVYRTTQVFTARGCPFPCTFCAISLVTTRTVRFRGADSVRRELSECRSRYGIEHVNVHDDTFTVSAKRVAEISRTLGESGVTWDCDTRVDTVSEEMLRDMAAHGCVRVAFGVESGSERMLKAMKKNVTRAQIRDAFLWARKYGITTSAYFIVGGHPDETPEDVEETRTLMHEIQPDFANVAIGTPYPGTELYGQLAERNLLLDRRWERFMLYDRMPAWRTERFSPEDLVRMQRDLIREYFYRPAYVWRRLRKMRSWRELPYWARSAWIGLRYVLKGREGYVASH